MSASVVYRLATVATAMSAACGASCGRTDYDATKKGDVSMTPPAGHTWTKQAVAAGVSIDVLPGAEVTRGTYQGVSYLWQAAPPARFGVSIGPGQGLASWRAAFSSVSVLGPETPVTVCGRPAVRQEATFAGGTVTRGYEHAADGAIQHLDQREPATTEIAVSFEARTGVPAVASWRIETSLRGAHRVDEDHFFASISCAD
jgi:hypothetical protein